MSVTSERIDEWVFAARGVLSDELPAGHKLWKSWGLDLADQVLALAAELRAVRDDNERLTENLRVREASQIPMVPRGAQRELDRLRSDNERLREALTNLRYRAPRSPIDVDISDYSDIYCLGFLAGQTNALDAALAASAVPGEDS